MLQYVQALNWRRCADDALQHKRKKTLKIEHEGKLRQVSDGFYDHTQVFSLFTGNILCNSPFGSFCLDPVPQTCIGRGCRRSLSLYVSTHLRAYESSSFCLEADMSSLQVLASNHWSHHSTNVHCSSYCRHFQSPVNSKSIHWLPPIVFPGPAVTKPFCCLINRWA